MSCVKLIWTVDAVQALSFRENYLPQCNMLLIQINWGDRGWFYLFPKLVQEIVFNQIGRQAYIILPKAGTNPRGVEISTLALQLLAAHPQSLKIPIQWTRKMIDFNPYNRWLALWQKD